MSSAQDPFLSALPGVPVSRPSPHEPASLSRLIQNLPILTDALVPGTTQRLLFTRGLEAPMIAELDQGNSSVK